MSNSHLSDRINYLAESQTNRHGQQLSRELTAKGIDVINLSLGEPDFITPLHIREGGQESHR
jgi:aspartate aminotransferase